MGIVYKSKAWADRYAARDDVSDVMGRLLKEGADIEGGRFGGYGDVSAVYIEKEGVGDMDKLRGDMYRMTGKYILYNLYEDDTHYCFVKEGVLQDYLRMLWENMKGNDSLMDYEEAVKLECLLREPLIYVWKWKDFSNRGGW